ncbi:MAG: hypothetical protein E6G92_10880 [Alphaproteobacteria bacterium]|nr:MAG: hypothetical protein E6G92_10880 [Alphaproteobacteria bacterium]
MRAVLGIVAGLIAGYLVLILIGIVAVGATYSVPHDVNLYNSRQVVELVLNMPAGPKIGLLVAIFGGTLAGAALAKLISRQAWPAWTVTIVYAILAGLGVMPFPIAAWMQAVTVAAPLLGGLIGNHLVKTAPTVVEPVGASEPAPPAA